MPTVDVPKLTPNQILVLVVLMSEARELTNNELRDLAGFALTGTDNAKLEKTLGLVETNRTHRLLSHQLTPKGWAVVGELHTTQPPKQGGSASRTLLTLLGNLNRAIDQLQNVHGLKLSLDEFFKQPDNAVFEPKPKPEPKAKPQRKRRSKTASAIAIESRIRTAYAELAPRPGEWVGLADLREHLADVSRAEVDEALMALLSQSGVRIIPAANSKAIKPRDTAAAINIGGEDNHALAIGQP